MSKKSSRRRFFYWRYRKAHPEKFPKKGLGGYYKPLSKEEATVAKNAGVSNDEYRYEQACSWAILMGEQLPDKKQFMADLAKRRAKR